ncbi:MAG: DUF349 domain-containing protein [Cytophagales bacterium]|nr:DUF349 domain-containing protein [Cytophagales bacterium]
MENEYGYIKDGKVYLKGFMEFPDREIGEVKEDETSTLNYFTERFELATQKVDELIQAIESATNKGSYLMKLLHMKDYLASFDALGDFTPLFNRLTEYENLINEIIVQNRAKNLEIKRALLLEGEAIVQQIADWKQTGELINSLKQRWLKTGNVASEFKDEIEGRFSSLLNDFYEKRGAFYEEKKKLTEAAVQEYEELVQLAESATEKKDDLAKSAEELKELQARWKTLGRIPKAVREELWERFRKANDLVFNQLKKERQELRSEKNKEHILSLLQRAESLLPQLESATESKDLQSLQADWKRLRIGREQFKNEKNKFFEICDMASEKLFVNRLAMNKTRDFDKKTEKEQHKIRLRFLKELYQRDQKELDIFIENSEKFHTAGSFNHLISNKQEMKERKVKVKKMLINSLIEKIKTLD